MDDKLLKILTVIAELIGMVLAYYIIPFLKVKAEEIKKTEKAKDAARIADMVQKAVLWAQQVYHDQTGELRKQAVEEFIYGIINREGLAITHDELDMLIEAAVKAMKIEEAKAIPAK